MLRLAFASLLLAARPACAQKYTTALGARLGGPDASGLTVQQRFGSRFTAEGLALYGPREMRATLLAEQHFGILGPSLNYYLGGGGHLGRRKTAAPADSAGSRGFGGFDAVLGVEYKVAFLPVVVSFDYKPTFELNSPEWGRHETAFSIRYVLVKRRTGLRRLFGHG